MMFAKWIFGLFAAVLLFIGLGCSGSVSAPKTADGKKITVLLLSDPGIKDNMEEIVKKERLDVCAWMDADFMRRLNEGGYETSKIQSPDEFTPAPGVYMVQTTLDDYRPARLTIREEAGLGKGVTEIDMTVELFQKNHTLPAMRYSKGVVSAREWTYCAGEINQKIVSAVSDRINELN